MCDLSPLLMSNSQTKLSECLIATVLYDRWSTPAGVTYIFYYHGQVGLYRACQSLFFAGMNFSLYKNRNLAAQTNSPGAGQNWWPI